MMKFSLRDLLAGMLVPGRSAGQGYIRGPSYHVLHHFVTRHTGFREPVVAEYVTVIGTMPRVENAGILSGGLPPRLGTGCRDAQ